MSKKQEPLVFVENLGYKYATRVILEKMYFCINEGENIALLGKNGSGKSTLIKGLNGLLIPYSGKYNISREYLSSSYDTDMYTIFSHPEDQILMPTIYSELALGLIQMNKTEQQINSIIEEMLTRFGLAEYINSSPYTLSTGEKKKLLLAIALTMNPALLILDEPFSGLDVKSKNELANYIRGISSTLIIATHEYDYASQCCQKALVISQKKIHYINDLQTLLNDQNLLSMYELC